MSEMKYKPSPEKVKSAVNKTKTRAEDYLRDPEKSKRLLDDAMKKVNDKEKTNGPLKELWKNLKALFRLLQAYFRHEYTDVAWGSLVLMVVAIIYFVVPIDLMPDWIPLAGFVDDGAVLVFVIAQIKSDLDKYLKWEADKEDNPDIIDL